MDACLGSRRDETEWQPEEGAESGVAARISAMSSQTAPGRTGGAVEYRVEEGGGRLGGGLQRLPGKAEVSGHSRVGERPAERRRRQG